MNEALQRIIDDFYERELPDLVERDYAWDQDLGKAFVFMGMRRVGKTYLCYQMVNHLLASGVSRENILYLNFEDDRLYDFQVGDFQKILDLFYGRFPHKKEERCYFFFDEVQNVEGWEKFIRRLLDTENISLCVTGSSAKLLSKEIATSLRGRSLDREVFPYSFVEFIRAEGMALLPNQRIGEKTRMSLLHASNEYLRRGGMPEVQSMELHKRHEVLQSYVDAVIFKDVVERYGVSNTTALRYLVNRVLNAPTTKLSVNKFHNGLKSQGVKVSKSDVYDFIDYLADAYLVFPVSIWSRSEKVKQVNPKKIYVIDNGIIDAYSNGMTEDRGALLENLVFLHLRSQGVDLHYYNTQKGNEVDFVFKQGGVMFFVQVCWSIEDLDTKNRELRALQEALVEESSAKGILVTWNDSVESIPGVQSLPLWQFLLSSVSSK